MTIRHGPQTYHLVLTHPPSVPCTNNGEKVGYGIVVLIITSTKSLEILSGIQKSYLGDG